MGQYCHKRLQSNQMFAFSKLKKRIELLPAQIILEEKDPKRPSHVSSEVSEHKVLYTVLGSPKTIKSAIKVYNNETCHHIKTTHFYFP